MKTRNDFLKKTNIIVVFIAFIFIFPITVFGAEYIIEGNDSNGNYFYGEVEIKKDQGKGFIRTVDGREKQIDLEQNDKGIFVGYDEDGNYFELEFD